MTAVDPNPSGGVPLPRRRMFSGLSLKERESFFLQLATILDSGIPIRDGLVTLAGRAVGKGGHILGDVAFAVEGGATLSEAMELHPEAFDAFTRALVKTGESVGRLDESLRRASVACRRARETRNRIFTGLLYPLLLLHAAIIIPNLVVLVNDGMGAYLWAVIPAVLVVYGTAILAWIAHSLFRDSIPYSGLRLKIPVFRKIALARFARSLAALYEGGLPLSESVKKAAASTGNEVLRRDFDATAARLSEGHPLTQSLPAGPQIPPMLRDMIATGERTGRLGETLNKAAEFFEEESATTIERTCRILPVVVYLMVALYIAIIVFRMWGDVLSQILKLA